MTKGELIDKVDEYNTAVTALHYDNHYGSDDIHQCIENIGLEWTTDHGVEVVAEMEKIFTNLENAMNDMERFMNAAKTNYVTVGFHNQTSETREAIN